MINFTNTRFVQSFTSKNDGSVQALPEVIFIGRSNVGKSSLINALINRRNFAYTSKKPGYTRLLNYFAVDDTFYLVDAPGYGYARVGRLADEKFEKMMHDYFSLNANLAQVYLLLDSRRTLSVEDEEFINFVRYHNLPLTVIFTKSDKLNQSLRSQAAKRYRELFDESDTGPLFTSSLKKENIEKLQNHISEVINDFLLQAR